MSNPHHYFSSVRSNGLLVLSGRVPDGGWNKMGGDEVGLD